MAEDSTELVDRVEHSPVGLAKEPVNDDGDEEMEDLFGDEEQESEGEENGHSNGEVNDDQSENEADEVEIPRRRGEMDMDDEEAEEQAMYTRKFYGEDAENASDQEEAAHHFKEEDVELVRHIVPYKSVADEEGKSTIYYAKIPEYLTIDPVPFDPPTFKSQVEERLKSSSREEQLGDRLIDENTVRWRYSRDENQQVYKESNAQIVQWSDGGFSLKLGAEYTDILVNDIDNTFFAVSHDQQELMQCHQGGEITKSLMFIPTSTNSKMHQKLTKAVIRRDQKQVSGPGVYIVNRDPELEKSELEKKQQQVIRERRRRQQQETESRNSPDPSSALHSYKRNPVAAENEQDNYYGSSRRNEYEQDDFLVDDDEEEEAAYSDENDVLDDNEEDLDAEEANAERLRQLKRDGAEKYHDRGTEGEFTTKRRKVAIIDDEDDD